jgi:hypothetical protein
LRRVLLDEKHGAGGAGSMTHAVLVAVDHRQTSKFGGTKVLVLLLGRLR